MAQWMKAFNQRSQRKVMFYGLDVYSLWKSMYAIVNYLDKKDR